MPGTGDVTQQILHELTLYGRRVRTLVQRLHPDLSFVGYTMLGHVYDEGGCRAVDLARVYELDKSTVSRQVGDLIRRGLLDRDQAGVLTVTRAGNRLLGDARRQQLTLLEERLSGWTADERRTFADLLRRYNAGE
jgi:DNA-binding MarR family transcriptional regulator